MTQLHYTTGKRKFNHLNYEQRKIIEKLINQKYPKVKIAELLGIARSTLYEELKRGTVLQRSSELKEYEKYFADVGQKVYEENRKNSRKPYKIAEATEFIGYAENQILNHHQSPDVICGRNKLTNKYTTAVCTKTLYNYIDKGFLKVKNIDLPLRVKRKIKTKRTRENRRILGDSIDNRPQNINDRSEFGHWEIDTVVGKREKGAVLLTLDERVTRKRIIVKISGRNTEAVAKGIEYIKNEFGNNFDKIFRSITSDNGSEFAKLSNTLPNTKIYYAHPYSSFERGTNEKQNSLIRYFYPKGRSFDNVEEKSVKLVQEWINDLPRKFANYQTSNELFNENLADLGIVL